MPLHGEETTGRKRRSRALHSAADRLVYTVPEAGRLLGLGRNAAYDAARRGDIPTIRMGRLLLVPKIPFHRLVGIERDDITAALDWQAVVTDMKTKEGEK